MVIKRNPLKKRGQVDEFITAADESRQNDYPWEGIDPEIVKLFNLRLPKPLKIKLEYIIKNTPHSSIHSFIMGEIENGVKREFKKMGIKR